MGYSSNTDLEEALILYYNVLKLEEPARRTREAIVDRVRGKTKEGEDGHRVWSRLPQFLGGEEVGSMSKVYSGSEDLVSLQPPEEEDLVSRFLANNKFFSPILRVNHPLQVSDRHVLITT